MRTNYASCPNLECEYHLSPKGHWYWRRGSFKTKWNGLYVPRFQCKKCRKTFSSHTFREHYRQKKPYLNEQVQMMISESTPIRGVARVLGISKTTVLRRLEFLGKLSERVLAEKRKERKSKTSYVQFDEMYTYQRTNCLPITVALAVRPKTGDIVSIYVGTVRCESPLKKLSLQKYGRRVDCAQAAVRMMLREVREVVRDEKDFVIASDSKGKYKKWVKKELPFAKHQVHVADDLQRLEKRLDKMEVKGEVKFRDFTTDPKPDELWVKAQKNGKKVIKAHDPLFRVNQKCMVLRSRLSRMRRRFWGYTQKIDNLQYNLWIFMVINNKYKLPK